MHEITTCTQGRLNSTIGPREKQCTGAHTYITTHSKWSIKLNIYLLYWYPQQNQCLNIKKKHTAHNIHRLAWDPYARGAPDNCPACPCVKTTLHLLV